MHVDPLCRSSKGSLKALSQIVAGRDLSCRQGSLQPNSGIRHRVQKKRFSLSLVSCGLPKRKAFLGALHETGFSVEKFKLRLGFSTEQPVGAHAERAGLPHEHRGESGARHQLHRRLVYSAVSGSLLLGTDYRTVGAIYRREMVRYTHQN